jgi:hypothetical protein
MKCACAVLYSHFWPVWLYHIFSHLLINCTIFGKSYGTSMNFSANFVWKYLSIRSQRDTFINLQTRVCKMPVYVVRLERNLNFLVIFEKYSNTKISWKSELLHVIRQTEGQTYMTKLKVAFWNFLEALKKAPDILQERFIWNLHSSGISRSVVSDVSREYVGRIFNR